MMNVLKQLSIPGIVAVALTTPGALEFSRAQTVIAQTEPNDSIATATPTGLTAGQTAGVITRGNNGDGPFGPTTGDSSGDFDFFALEADPDQRIILDVDGVSIGRQMDTVAGIFDANGLLVASNDDDGSTTDSLIRFDAASAGTYYAVVGSWVAGDPQANMPSNPNSGGNGVGVPAGGVDDYEAVVGLDMPVFLVDSPLNFPLIGRDETTEAILTLTNEGWEEAIITDLALKGNDAPSFDVSETLPITLGAGGTRDITVSFDPKGSNEERLAVLEIVSNDVVRPTKEIPIRGKAIDGLVLRLGFDDPDGSPLNSFAAPLDLSGNGFRAAYVVNSSNPTLGRPSLVGGDGFSVGFDDGGGTANYVLTDNDFPHTPTVSYSLWIRSMAGSGEDALFNRDPQFSQNDGIFGLGLLADGSLRFRIAGTGILITEPDTIEEGTIYHIVLTHLDRDGFGTGEVDRTRLYVDGELLAEETDTLEFPLYPEVGATNTRLWIATRSAAGRGYTGDMDDFQVYNIELTPDEVRDMFDNPGTVASSTPSAPIQITDISFDSSSRNVNLTWSSRPGKNYILESSSNLSEPWLEVGAIASGGESTSATDEGVPDDVTERYYRVTQVPPPAFLETSFEDGAPDWSLLRVPGSVETGTTWEIGPPANGPESARTGENAAGTGLGADYEDGTMISLRSPIVDPAGTRNLRLEFWYYLQTNEGEGGRVNLRETNGDLIQSMGQLFDGGDSNTEAWTPVTMLLPNLDPPRPFIVEFEFLSADDGDPNNGAGWFIDDLRIGK